MKNISVRIYLFILLTIQIVFSLYAKNYPPNLSIVPDVPSKSSIKAFAFGDEQLYFRILAYRIQNAGDTFGRFTALKLYNYRKLYNWFCLLDELDSKSDFVPSLASYYFSQTQNSKDVIYVVNYLSEHASKDLYHKWWWLSQAVYLANYKLHNKDLALRLAYKLASTPRNDIPLWAKQMPAFIHEQRGEYDQALVIINHIIDNINNIPHGELNFMSYFIKERLGKMEDIMTKYKHHKQH